jgi:hypothetical protein
LEKTRKSTFQNLLCRKPVRIAKLWKKNADSSTTIMHQRSLKTWRIDSTGSEIWELCDGLHTLEDILEVLAERFSEDVTYKSLCEEVNAFLTSLLKRN